MLQLANAKFYFKEWAGYAESNEEHKLCQALGRDVSCHNSQAKITILLHDVCHITINSQAKITFLMCQC